MDPLSVIASVIAITGAIATSCKAVNRISGLPRAFRQVERDLPLIQKILKDAVQRLNTSAHTEEQRKAILAIAEPCNDNARKLKAIFDRLEAKCNHDQEPTSWLAACVWYREAVRSVGAFRVESLMSDLLRGVEMLALNEVFNLATQQDLAGIKRAVDELSEGCHHAQGKLICLDGAAFDAASKQHSPSCLQGTRRQVLTEIREWADGNDERRIYWLKGMAGTGKSTVALTIAREYAEKERLGASFFFSRGGGDLASAQRFATTIAAQLAEVSSVLRQRVDDAIAANPRVNSLGLYDQWAKLVLQPLAQASENLPPFPLLIVVDALDECEDEDDVSLLIRCFESATAIDGIQLRLLISSRPDQSVDFAFHGISLEAHRDFILHDIEQNIVDEDLAKYYKNELIQIERRSGLTGSLFSDDTVDCLVRRSCGLFIHAATVCRFIRDGRQFGRDRLSLILLAGTSPVKPETELDLMYATVLRSSFGASLDLDDFATSQNSLRYIVGSTVVLLDTMSPAGLARLLAEPKEHVISTLRRLQSVLYVPEQDDRQIRLLHPSFRDFLLNPLRYSNSTFKIDAEDTHGHLLNCCLQTLSINLRRNMCSVQRPGTRVRDIPKPDVERRIPVPVQYACRYWVHHLQLSNIDPREHAGIVDFFRTRFLFWIETLSLIGRLADGITAVGLLEALLSSSDTLKARPLVSRIKAGLRRKLADDASPALTLMVYDAKRFLLSHASIIEQAPLQIYCSAILFSPTESITRKNFFHHLPKWISHLPIVRKNWSSYLQTLNHSDEVYAVAFSPAKKVLATATADNTARLWDATTGAERIVLKGHAHSVRAVAFSPNGKVMATASWDTTARLWDATTGTERMALKGHSSGLNAVAFSPDGRVVATSSLDMTVRLWDATTGSERAVLEGHTHSVDAVTFSPDGKVVATASWDQTVRLWDATTGAERRVLNGHLDMVRAVAFSPDGKVMATASCDTTARLWDATTGTERMALRGHSSGLNAVAFSPDGRVVATSSLDMTVRLWDATTGREQRVLKGHSAGVNAAAFSFDGKVVATASYDKTVRLWDATTDTRRRTPEGHFDWKVACSPDGKVVVTSSGDRTVRLWDAKAGTERKILKGHSHSVRAVAFSPNGRTMATASSDKTVRLWDATTGTERRVLTGHSHSVDVVAFSPDGKVVATASGDWTVRVWDVMTGAERRVLRGHLDMVSAVAFSPDGRVVATASNDKTARLWDAATGEESSVLEGHWSSVDAVAFSPDGKAAATVSGDMAWLWDATTGTERRVFKGHLDSVRSAFSPNGKVVAAVTFSPDGQVVATASWDKTARLWDTTTGAEQMVLKGHLDSVRSVAFSPDGRAVVTASWDQTVRVWDATTGAEQWAFFANTPLLHLPFYDARSVNFQALLVEHRRSLQISASRSWVREAEDDLLFVHPDYQGRIGFVAGSTVVFIDEFSGGSRLQLSSAEKSMTEGTQGAREHSEYLAGTSQAH